MTTTTKNKRPIVKFGGTVALILTVCGLLLAAGGQLDFIGAERSEAPVATATPESSEKNGKQAKYSFYDELKKRKTELDSRRGVVTTGGSTTQSNTSGAADSDLTESYRYVIQAGAFSHKSDAEKVQKRAQALGYSVKIHLSDSKKYLIYVGPFQGKKKSVSVQERLNNQKFDTLLRRVP